MIYVVTNVEALHGHRDELLAAIERRLTVVRTRPGCIACDVGTPMSTPILVQEHFDRDVLTVVSQWKDFDYYLAHRNCPELCGRFAESRHLIVHVETRILEPGLLSNS